MSFFENTRKPVGFGGKIMVAMMNLGHSPVARWGLRFLNVAPDARVLDCGCGGGANIKRLLKKCPEGIVKGIDYSPVSVEKSKKVNEAAIAEGRCTVLQGSVADMIFADDWCDAVTAFETVLDLIRFPADKPRHAFQVSHVHIRVHSIQPCFQAGSCLVGLREKSYLFINAPDKPIRPLLLALHIEAATECPAGSQDPENLPISCLLFRESVKAVQ